MEQQHEMVLETTHSSGAEEWYCPICGRRMLINWHPQFKRDVLEAGDVYARHNASKGFLSNVMTSSETSSDDRPETEPEVPMTDLRLTPWLTWFEKVNFNSLWDKPNRLGPSRPPTG